MAALTVRIPLKYKSTKERWFPVADDVKLFPDAICRIDSAGRATPMTDAASSKFGGIVTGDKAVDNTLTGHTAGGKNVLLSTNGTAVIPADTGLNAVGGIGKVAYGLFDNQVDAVGDTTNDIPVGTIQMVESIIALGDPSGRAHTVEVAYGYGTGIPGDIT